MMYVKQINMQRTTMHHVPIGNDDVTDEVYTVYLYVYLYTNGTNATQLDTTDDAHNVECTTLNRLING